MSYAFMNSTTLYEMDLGTVKVIGDKAFYNCPQLGRVWFSNVSTKVVNNGKSIDLTIGEDAVFTNWGMYLDGRLRVYVPSGTDAEGFDDLQEYKKILQNKGIMFDFRNVKLKEMYSELQLSTIDNVYGIKPYFEGEMISNNNDSTNYFDNFLWNEINSELSSGVYLTENALKEIIK